MMMLNLQPIRNSVYERRTGSHSRAAWLGALVVGASLLAAVPVVRAQNADAAVVDAREALRKKDRSRLTADRAVAVAANHPLAMWVEYWELTNRLGEAQQAEVTGFAARWNGTYVEDRLRNDWLLELG